MQQKLLRKAGLLLVAVIALGWGLSGCIDEPNPPVRDEVTSSVRFVHAVSDAPAVDIWADGVKVAENVGYKGYTSYLNINSGNRFIRVTPAGSDTSQAVFRQLTSFRSVTQMTIVFFGLSSSGINMLLTQERFTYSDETDLLADSADVKIININERLEAVKAVADSISGPTLLPAVNAYALSPYRKIIAAPYNFVFVTDPQAAEVTRLSMTLSAKSRYSFILFGTAAEPQLLALTDPGKPN
jgi:hypothetical protein